MSTARRIHAYIEGSTLDRMAQHVPAQLGQSVDDYVNALLDYFQSKIPQPQAKAEGRKR
ncbi:MAG: hypothetical protein ACREBU_06595 [Nitrososphaera sp.]